MKARSIAAVALLTALCILLMCLPLPRTVSPAKQRYLCSWADGRTEESTYAALLGDVVGCGADGSILLSRGGMAGSVAGGQALANAHAVLAEGSLLELRLLDTGGLSRLAAAALWREFGSTVWYADGAFRLCGTSVEPADPAHAGRVVLLGGSLPSGYLAELGAPALRLTSAAELKASDLLGSKVADVTATPPYSAVGGGIYRETAGGKRFVAALPAQTSLEVETCAFADEGALAACTSLTRLSLPFVGSAASGTGTAFSCSLAYLFETKNGNTMSEVLTSVSVSGGRLDAFCFLGADGLREIDACGVDPAFISAQAFSGLPALRLVHTPRRDVLLPEGFTATAAPCGCTVYQKTIDERSL